MKLIRKSSVIVEEDSNKSYLSMVVHHQTILEYSIINQQIIHSFKTDIYISIFEFIEAISFIEVLDSWK